MSGVQVPPGAPSTKFGVLVLYRRARPCNSRLTRVQIPHTPPPSNEYTQFRQFPKLSALGQMLGLCVYSFVQQVYLLFTLILCVYIRGGVAQLAAGKPLKMVTVGVRIPVPLPIYTLNFTP